VTDAPTEPQDDPARVRHAHDRLVRHVLAHPEEAADLIRPILPAEVAARFDWSTLRLVAPGDVDRFLRERITDLTFDVVLDGGPGSVLLLFEHLSGPRKDLPLVVLRHLLLRWERWIDSEAASPGPIVVPVVLYHGPPVWSGPLTVSALLGIDPARRGLAKRFVPDVETALLDLTPLSVDELRARAMSPLARITLVLLARTRTDDDLVEIFKALAPDLRALSARGDSQAACTAIVVYVASVRRETPWKAIMDTVETMAGPETSGKMRCALDDLLDEGRSAEARRFLERLLRQRFGDLPGGVAARLTGATLADLQRWGDRLLTAPTPEAVVELA
jgi:hypothetical protein